MVKGNCVVFKRKIWSQFIIRLYFPKTKLLIKLYISEILSSGLNPCDHRFLGLRASASADSPAIPQGRRHKITI